MEFHLSSTIMVSKWKKRKSQRKNKSENHIEGPWSPLHLPCIWSRRTQIESEKCQMYETVLFCSPIVELVASIYRERILQYITSILCVSVFFFLKKNLILYGNVNVTLIAVTTKKHLATAFTISLISRCFCAIRRLI